MKKHNFAYIGALLSIALYSVPALAEPRVLPTIPCKDYGLPMDEYNQCFKGGRVYLGSNIGVGLIGNLINLSQQEPIYLFVEDWKGRKGFEIYKHELQGTKWALPDMEYQPPHRRCSCCGKISLYRISKA